MRFSCLLILLFFAHYPQIAASGEKEREHILVSFTRLQAVESDFQQQRLQGQLSRAEELDYQAYITRLQNQFHQDCVALAQADIQALKGKVPCPSILPRNPGVAVIDQRHERTRSEHTRVLASELDRALGEFDEMLLREQERVKAATPATASSIAAGTETTGGQAGDTAAKAHSKQEDTTDSTALTGPVDASAGAEVDGDAVPSRQTGLPGQQQVSKAPPDIPDGSDDDVVARQLREAAEKESDPELKQRLWEEYRSYKRGTE